MQLRDYQLKAAFAFRLAVHNGHKRVLEVLATGLGKTELFAYIADRWVNGRVLVMAPRVDLVGEAARKIKRRTGEWPAIEQANLRSVEHSFMRSRFIVASQQTLVGGRYKRLSDIGLVVVDEAHLALTEAVEEMLAWFIGKGAVGLGLTATPKRGDKKAMGQMWQVCPFVMDISAGIREGWLCPARVQCVQLKSLDLSTIAPARSGDFSEKKLAEVMGQDRVVYEVADVTARESAGLKTVVFCTHVYDARAVAELLHDQYGLRAEWVCGDLRLCSKQRRKEILDSFTGDPHGVQIVCNVGVLSTGWDFPGLEHIVNARPTMSEALFTQIFGRGTRALEGVVDFEGSTAESRRAAIANSAKPFFKFTDLRDVALQHRLISVVDVLGGSLGMIAKQKARDAFGEGGPREVDEVLREAAKKAQEEEAARERNRRNAVAARADYAVVNVDPFSPGGRQKSTAKKEKVGPRMLFGKHRGKPIKFVESSYLRWFRANITLNAKSAWLGVAIDEELAARKQRSPVRGERFA